MTHQEYLGDGVYAHFDGYQIWLGLSAGKKTIALEPDVLNALMAYVRRVFPQREQR